MTSMHNTLSPGIREEIVRRLIQDFDFKQREKYLQQGRCPKCKKREMYVSIEQPYLVKCGRENNCAHEIVTRTLYADLFDNWSERYESTPQAPHAIADAYLTEGRGLDISLFKGAYTQGAFAKANMGSATVRFTLANGTIWERIIDKPERFGKQKANIIGGYTGYWWEAPGQDLLQADKIFITEGIFNAMSLVQAGYFAVASLSSNNYPSALLDMLAEHWPEDKSRARIIWAFDDDKAGRSHAVKFAEQAAAAGWPVGAALPSENGSNTDWNDLLKRDRLTAGHMKDYRYYGRLLLSKSALEKATHIFQHRNKDGFSFDFNFETYWFSLDIPKYEKAIQYIMEFDKRYPTEEEAREAALKECGSLKRIVNARLETLYYQRPPFGDDGWYYLRVQTRYDKPVKGAFTAGQMATAAEFKKRLLSIAKGVVFSGSTGNLDVITTSMQERMEVKTQDFIGYNKDFGAWLFNDVAVSAGQTYRMNDEDYFGINKLSVKSLSAKPQLAINPDLGQFRTDWLDDLWTAYGPKGYITLAFWFGSLFAEQIRAKGGSFPFLFIIGDPGSGKTTLLKFLWRLVGEKNYEGFDPCKSSISARGRNFARVGNLPVVLIESERDSVDNKSKYRSFDFDELKSLYDGSIAFSRGVATSDNSTHEPPFRGSIAVAQNADPDASPAIQSRAVRLFYGCASHSQQGREASNRLKQADVADVSGFIIAATRKEAAVLEAYERFSDMIYPEIEKQVSGKHSRVTLTHSQFGGMLHAMAEVLPIHPDRLSETHSYLLTLAVEREKSLSKDHPLVQEFWEMFDYLDSLEQFGINHAANREGEIAVNFNHFEEVANSHRQRLPFTLSEIKKLLKSGKGREFVRPATVRSEVSRQYNCGKAPGLHKPERYQCWIFKRKD